MTRSNGRGLLRPRMRRLSECPCPSVEIGGWANPGVGSGNRGLLYHISRGLETGGQRLESVRRVSVAPVLCSGLEIKQGSQDWTHGKIFFVRDRRRDKGFRLDASALRSDVFLVFLPGVVAT